MEWSRQLEEAGPPAAPPPVSVGSDYHPTFIYVLFGLFGVSLIVLAYAKHRYGKEVYEDSPGGRAAEMSEVQIEGDPARPQPVSVGEGEGDVRSPLRSPLVRSPNGVTSPHSSGIGVGAAESQYTALVVGSLDEDSIQLAPEELEDLLELFAKHDLDGNGQLDADEFEKMVGQIAVKRGKVYSSRQLRALFKRADSDGNGVIDFQEFIEMQQAQQLEAVPTGTTTAVPSHLGQQLVWKQCAKLQGKGSAAVSAVTPTRLTPSRAGSGGVASESEVRVTAPLA